MRILFAYADHAEAINTSQWRCLIPAAGLQRAGHQVEILTTAQITSGTHHFNPSDFDVAVVERALFDLLDIIPKWREAGLPIIATFDDAYHLMPSSIISALIWRKGVDYSGQKRDFLKQFKRGLRKCSAYITPSEVLTEDYLNINPRGYTVRNYPDLTWDCWHEDSTRPKGKIRMIWGGSASHYESWAHSAIVPAVKQILEEYPNVSLTLAGGDIRINALFSGLSHHQLHYVDYMPFKKWPRFLGRYDIGLAPLHGEYDRRRSWIKVLEYCLRGVLPVASGLEPYQGTPALGVSKDKSIVWYKTMKEAVRLVSSGEHMERATANLQWALKQGIDDHVHEYVDVFSEVMG